MLPEGVQHIGKPGMLENHGDGDHGGLKRKTTGLLVAPQQLARSTTPSTSSVSPHMTGRNACFDAPTSLRRASGDSLLSSHCTLWRGVIMYRTVRPPKRMTRATMARSSGLNTLSRQSE